MGRDHGIMGKIWRMEWDALSGADFFVVLRLFPSCNGTYAHSAPCIALPLFSNKC
jgi:hypothetical protein